MIISLKVSIWKIIESSSGMLESKVSLNLSFIRNVLIVHIIINITDMI